MQTKRFLQTALILFVGISFEQVQQVLGDNTNYPPTNINTNTIQTPGTAAGGTVGDPIGIMDGVMVLEERDLLISAPLINLNFSRTWRSDYQKSSSLGSGWVHSYEWKISYLTESTINQTTSTNVVYQGKEGDYVKLEAFVNPHTERYQGGTYYFYKIYSNPTLENTSAGTSNEVRKIYKLDGQGMPGVSLICHGDWSWTLKGFQGDGLIYKFNYGGELSRIEHPANVWVSFDYDHLGRLTNVMHQNGSKLIMSYNGTSDQLVSVRNNHDTNLWVEYSTVNNPMSGYTKRFTATRHISANSADNLNYDYYYITKAFTEAGSTESRSLIKRKDVPNGEIYYWGYENTAKNGEFRANRSWIESGSITNYNTTLSYVDISPIRARTDVTTSRKGVNSLRKYEIDLLKIENDKILGPLEGQTEERVYDTNNNLLQVGYSLGYEEFYSGADYDVNDNPVKLYSCYGGNYLYETASLTWTTNRLLSSIKDVFNAGIGFEYEDTLLSGVNLLGTNGGTIPVLSAEYNNGRLTNIVDGNGNEFGISYITTTTEDKVTYYWPEGEEVRCVYDRLGRLKHIIEWNTEGEAQTNWFESDYAGRILKATNALNQVTEFTYDKAGNLLKAEDAGGRYITNSWRLGKRISSTMGRNGSSRQARISFDYDPQMTMVKVTDPKNRNVETYGLDAAGQIVTVTNQTGQTMEIVRGVLGNINELKRYDGTRIYLYYNYIYGVPEMIIYPDNSYYAVYQENGLVSQIQDNDGTVYLEYDQWNRLTNIAGMTESWISWINNFSYDNAGNVIGKRLVAHDGWQWTNAVVDSIYQYDGNGRLAIERDRYSNDVLWSYSYNPYQGMLERSSNAVCGFYTDYSYDKLGRVTRMETRKGNGAQLFLVSYQYDASGFITNKTVSGTGMGSTSTGYIYDELGMLIREQIGSVQNIYSYDLAGNRLSAKGESYYTPASDNRLSSWGIGGSMSYNTAGCVTALSRNNRMDLYELGWDSEYRLSYVNIGDENYFYSVYYGYDTLGRLSYRGGGEYGEYEYYVYDGKNRVADIDSNGYIVRSYSYGEGIDDVRSLTVYDENGNGQTYYYLKDLANTVYGLVDGNGTLVEYYEYEDAYGNVRIYNSSGAELGESAYGNPFYFQGRVYDKETELYHFRARWYDPETGRWLSPDPIGISAGLNLYLFCNNNPVNFIDPEGLWGIMIGDFLIGSGDPYLVIDEEVVEEIPVGVVAVVDGMINSKLNNTADLAEFLGQPEIADMLRNQQNPLESFYEDECGNVPDIYKQSRKCGEFANEVLSLRSKLKRLRKVLF